VYRAQRAHEEALRRARDAGLGFYVPYALQALANYAVDRLELERATTLSEEALLLFERRDDRWGILLCLERLTRIARLLGERDRVATLARETLSSRAIGSAPPVVYGFQNLAWVARVDALPARAVRLLGAADAIHQATGRRTPASVRQDQETESTLLREALGDAAFETAWNEGRAMSVDQAVRYALEEIDVKPGGPRAWPS